MYPKPSFNSSSSASIITSRGFIIPNSPPLPRLELKIRPLVKELRFYFDGHTTIHPQSKFIVFNIRNVGYWVEERWEKSVSNEIPKRW